MIKGMWKKTMKNIALMLTILMAGTTLTGATAIAQEADAAVNWKGDAELGYIGLRGNSDSDTLNAKLDINREAKKWRNNLHLEASNTAADKQRSAEKYWLSSKADYIFDEHNYAFTLISYEDDHFSGYDYQATVSAGYGRQLIASDTVKLSLEAGPGYRVNEFDNGEKEEDAIVRIGENYTHAISKSAQFEQSLNVEHGSDNTISRLQAAIKSSIIGNLALKIAITLKYTDIVPIDTERLDQETTVTLVYSF